MGEFLFELLLAIAELFLELAGTLSRSDAIAFADRTNGDILGTSRLRARPNERMTAG
jgi:hypothetical protein